MTFFSDNPYNLIAPGFLLIVVWMLTASHRNVHNMFRKEIREALAALTAETPLSKQLKLCASIAFKIDMLCEFRTFTRIFTPRALKRLNVEGKALKPRYDAIQTGIKTTEESIFQIMADTPNASLKDIFVDTIGPQIEATQAAMQALLPDALAFAENVRAYIK